MLTLINTSESVLLGNSLQLEPKWDDFSQLFFARGTKSDYSRCLGGDSYAGRQASSLPRAAGNAAGFIEEVTAASFLRQPFSFPSTLCIWPRPYAHSSNTHTVATDFFFFLAGINQLRFQSIYTM